MSSEIEWIIYSYFEINHLLRICDYHTIDQIFKRYPQPLPTICQTCGWGTLKRLKYLIHRGQKVDIKDFEIALDIENFEIVRHIYNSEVIPNKTLMDYLNIRTIPTLAMLMYLINLGVKFDEVILDNTFYQYDNLRLRYLCSIGYKGSKNLLNTINHSYTNYDDCVKNLKYLIDYDIIDPTELLKIATATANIRLINILQNL